MINNNPSINTLNINQMTSAKGLPSVGQLNTLLNFNTVLDEVIAGNQGVASSSQLNLERKKTRSKRRPHIIGSKWCE